MVDIWDEEPHYPDYLRDEIPDEDEMAICIYCGKPLEPDKAIISICLECRKLGLGR